MIKVTNTEIRLTVSLKIIPTSNATENITINMDVNGYPQDL